jgi:hypothetical protein
MYSVAWTSKLTFDISILQISVSNRGVSCRTVQCTGEPCTVYTTLHPLFYLFMSACTPQNTSRPNRRHSKHQREGRGLTIVLPCLPCAIELITSTTAAGFARSLQLSSPRPGRAVRSVREGGRDRPSQPAGPLSFIHPGGPPCKVISLAFGLIWYTHRKQGRGM